MLTVVMAEPSARRILALDIGTSRSRAAYTKYASYKPCRPVLFEQTRHDYIPTELAWTKKGEWIIGQEVDNHIRNSSLNNRDLNESNRICMFKLALEITPSTKTVYENICRQIQAQIERLPPKAKVLNVEDLMAVFLERFFKKVLKLIMEEESEPIDASQFDTYL